MNTLMKFIAKMLTLFVYPKSKRKIKKFTLEKQLKAKFYGRNVIKNAKLIGKNFSCNGFSYCNSKTELGDYVNFNGMRITGNEPCKIGNYFHSGIECLILTQNHNYKNDTMIPYDRTYISKNVEIGDFVWLGSRVTLLPGTKIGEGAIIQAGSVVHGEIPPYAIAGGNPAKVFMNRDVEHFKKLKSESKFLDLAVWGETLD